MKRFKWLSVVGFATALAACDDGTTGTGGSGSTSGTLSTTATGMGGGCAAGDKQSCYEGPAGTENVGLCKAGEATCVDGAFGACVGAVEPAAEDCDGFDNDCDGTVDNGCDCTDGDTQSCYGGPMGTSGVGLCKSGTQTCVNGKFGACTGDVVPAMEACDGLDNNCDGAVDDGFGVLTCGIGACGATVPECAMGMLQTCIPGMPTPEVCDTIDNNCDGTVDENLGQTTCGLGACEVTVDNCVMGQSQTCTPGMPTAETCDNVDNDCDGAVDNGDPGGGVACNTGLLGACAAGTSACQNGAVVCVQTVMPTAETCNNVDDNCDGNVDEGNPGGGGSCTSALQGPCAPGTNACQSGAVVCVPNVMPTAETCDNVDNDCDGLVDDGSTPLNLAFVEDFSDNGNGWALDATWQIGSATASTGHEFGSPDPAADHTSTNDNGIAGVVIGGNYGKSITPARYLTSPVINTSGMAGKVYLSFWRWLNSDYPPYLTNTVEVFNGTTWSPVYSSDAGVPVTDSSWQKLSYDITAYKSANMRVRFSYVISNAAVFNGSGWNIDDLVVSNSPNPNIFLRDEFSDTSQGWTLGTSWAIGPTATSSGQVAHGPDPATDFTPGSNNGVMGVVLAGTAPINHPTYYATSKVMDTSGAASVVLSFKRWLNSDYAPHMINYVEVFNGTTSNIVFQSGGFPGLNDLSWQNQVFDLTAFKSATMQVRIGYSAASTALVVSGWNVDDLVVTGGTVCQ